MTKRGLMNSSFDNNLTEPMKQLVNRVESFTEKPIVFEVEDTLAIPAKVSMARGNKPNHVISIGPQYKHDMDAIQYLVAHECCHILRRFGVEPQERLVIQKTGKINARLRLESGAAVPEQRNVFPNTNLEIPIPTRTSVLGFLAGWGCVAIIVYLVYLITRM